MPKKIAFLLGIVTEKNFSSGGEKVNFGIIQAFKDCGYTIDLYCHKYIGENDSIFENIYIDKYAEFYKKQQEYLFSFSENADSPTTFSYIHENTRFFRKKYLYSKLTYILIKLFNHNHYLKTEAAIAEHAENAKHINKFIVPSELIKKDILEAYNKSEQDIFILPPFADKTNSFNKESHETFTFGLSARGFENKGGWEFIIAIILLNLRGIKCNAVIIYPFSKTAKILQKILLILRIKNIKIIDYCSDMNKFYSQIDCLVMASKREAFGLVAIEAISREIPVIVNTRCGVQDFISHGKNGFVYDYKKPIKNLMNILVYVMQNQQYLPELTKNALQIKEELSYDNFKKKLKIISDRF